MRGERVEGLVPLVHEPLLHVAKALGSKGIQVARADGTMRDEARLFEHAQVLAHGGAADGEGLGERSDRDRSAPQGLDDEAPRRISEGVKGEVR